MKKRRRILTVALLVLAFIAALWLFWPRREPLFHSQPESYWITNIVYYGPDEQTARWRAFGPDGVRLLTGALDRSYGLQHSYRRVYRRYAYKLPGFVANRLPTPIEPRHTRMCILSLLSQMSHDTNLTRIAESAVARALKDDDSGVCGIALSWYSSGASLTSAEVKKARLPDFLRLVQDDDQWLRNNAAGALRHYREEAQIVAPVLVNVLQETNPQIQMTIAGALADVDPQMAVKAGVVPIAIGILKNPDDQIAYRAAELLGRLATEPAVSVPALIEAVQGTNDLVAITAMFALVKFREPGELIVPALSNALTHPHGQVRRYARDALNRIDPAAANAGVK